MAYYTKEAIEEAKKIDALTYLKTFNPSELVQDSRNVYSTKTHDSLKFSNGKWYWFSHGFGGYNALDYLMKVEELSFMDAMNKLVKTDGLILEENPYYNQKDKINRLILPEKNNNNDKIIKYLSSRGIDINIIFDCINNELIYESKENKNVVFVGKDLNNNPRFATIRGSSEKRFMYEASGSDKKYSFRLLSKTSNNTVHVFESAIDLLSYATILKLGNKDYKLENLLSLSGVYQSTGNGNRFSMLWSNVIYGQNSGEYVNWRQTDSRWSSVRLGNTNSTIGQIGCLVTSISVLIDKSGVNTEITPFNPGIFVEALNKNGGFDDSGNLKYYAIQKVVPRFSFVGNVNLRGKTRKQKMQLINKYISDGYYISAEVKGATSGSQHWVAVMSVSNNIIYMVDPASSSTDMWSSYEWSKTSQFVYFRAN